MNCSSANSRNQRDACTGVPKGHQAATAALALLAHTERNISELERDPEFASIKILRVRDVRIRGPVALSLQTLVERSRGRLLFANSPLANSSIALLADALPEASPLIVEGKTAEFLRDSSNSIARCHEVRESILELVKGAARFGTKEARRKLLERLRPTDDDDRAALRCLCVGDMRAKFTGATLYVLEGTPRGLERFVEAVLDSDTRAFLVPAEIAEELPLKLQRHIGITTLDTPLIESLLEREVNVITGVQMTFVECDAFLLTDLSGSLLRTLPIHARSDGSVGNAEDVFREGDRPIPEALRSHVLTIQLSTNREARER